MSKLKKERPLTATLTIKNKRYYAVFNHIGKDGEPKTIWRTLELEAKPGNKRKAQYKMEEMKRQFHGVIDVPGYEIPFMDYLYEWKEKKKSEVEESTYLGIKGYVDRTIRNYFENMRLSLSEVKPKHIHHFYEHLYKNGRADGRGGLSISTIKSIKSILNEVFKNAVIEGLIIANPVEVVKLPAKDNPRKPHTVLNQESANKLLGYVIEDELMYPLLLTALRYGLRHSEVLGLTWGAVDFQNDRLRIEKTITRGKNPEKIEQKQKPVRPPSRYCRILKKLSVSVNKRRTETERNWAINTLRTIIFLLEKTGAF